VSTGILFDGQRWLYFHDAKVNADNFTKHLLLKLAEACHDLISKVFAFQYDMARLSWNDSNSGITRQPLLKFIIVIVIVITMERA